MLPKTSNRLHPVLTNNIYCARWRSGEGSFGGSKCGGQREIFAGVRGACAGGGGRSSFPRPGLYVHRGPGRRPRRGGCCWAQILRLALCRPRPMNNGVFMAAHRARQVARDVTADSFADENIRAPRVDVSVSLIAEVCGLTEARLAQLMPKEWRWERDWRVLGGVTFYNRAALPLLVGVLSTSGEPAAAVKLMGFLTPDECAGVAAGVTALPAGRGGAAGNSGLGCASRTTAASAQQRKGWAQAWEESHL